MSAIVELRVPADSFELGRILASRSGVTFELERLVPLRGDAVPFLFVYDADWEAFADSIERHAAVDDVSVVDIFEDVVLFALDWTAREDDLLSTIAAHDGSILEAEGDAERWRFRLRFRSHDGLSAFRTACEARGLDPEIGRVTSPPESSGDEEFGMTDIQRETLRIAVEAGYYDIPRRCTTVELAEMLGISDQAVTERLRRAIVSLVSNTLETRRDDA